jgi:hypothetical protein
MLASLGMIMLTPSIILQPPPQIQILLQYNYRLIHNLLPKILPLYLPQFSQIFFSYSLHLSFRIYLCLALMVEAIRISETSVYFHETTCRYIPDSCQLRYHTYSVFGRCQVKISALKPVLLVCGVSYFLLVPPVKCCNNMFN